MLILNKTINKRNNYNNYFGEFIRQKKLQGSLKYKGPTNYSEIITAKRN